MEELRKIVVAIIFIAVGLMLIALPLGHFDYSSHQPLRDALYFFVGIVLIIIGLVLYYLPNEWRDSD